MSKCGTNSGRQCSGHKEQHVQSLGDETELRAFWSLKSELLFILAHRRASIHFDYYHYYVKEENFASNGSI